MTPNSLTPFERILLQQGLTSRDPNPTNDSVTIKENYEQMPYEMKFRKIQQYIQQWYNETFKRETESPYPYYINT
jgi:hypothetical protein